MDFTFRCNITSCRVELAHQAVVTTCSHIFCLDCAQTSGLGHAKNGARQCPACQTQLLNRDDAVITQLDPSEDYKTSVLSGFTPTLIVECASRALAFFNYQAVHEATYQEFLARRLTQKVTGLNDQLDSTIKDANSHVQKLKQALNDSESRCLELEDKGMEIQNAFKQKAKALAEVTKKYELLKSEKMAAQTMNAASDEAEQVMQAMAGSRFANGMRRLSSASSKDREGLGRLHSMQQFPQPAQSMAGLSNPLFVTPAVSRTFSPGTATMSRQSRATISDNSRLGFRQPLSHLSQHSLNSHHASGFHGISVAAKVGRRPLKNVNARTTRQQPAPSDLPMR